MKQTFQREELQGYRTFSDVDTSIFVKGVFADVDVLSLQVDQLRNELQIFRRELCNLVAGNQDHPDKYRIFNCVQLGLGKIKLYIGIKMKITYRPIGIIHSPFKEPKGTPIQPNAAKGIEGMIEVFPQYEKGLKDIEGFSHIILIYHFHLSKTYSLEVKPYMDIVSSTDYLPPEHQLVQIP